MNSDMLNDLVNECAVRGMYSDRTPTTNDIPKSVIGKEYFITGSVSFGCAKCDSDVDICVPIMQQPQVENSRKSDYNNGYKFKEKGIVYNIIPLHPLDYCAWSRATKMANSVGMFADMPKQKRVPMFEMLCAISKMSLEKHVNSHNYLEFV